MKRLHSILLLLLPAVLGCAATTLPQQQASSQEQESPAQVVPLGQLYSRSAQRAPSVSSMGHLLSTLQEHTAYHPVVSGALALDDPAILHLPWVYLSPANRARMNLQQMTDAELGNLGTYLAGGGFLVTGASGNPETLRGGVFSLFREALTRKGLLEGNDWLFVRLKPSHAIYHCLFDFDPEGFDIGLLIDGHLTVLMSTWPLLTDHTTLRVGELEVDGRRFVQFTANTVVFAVTQSLGQ